MVAGSISSAALERGQRLIDALPYADADSWTEAMQERVAALVRDEARASSRTPADWERELEAEADAARGPAGLPGGAEGTSGSFDDMHPLVKKCLERIARREAAGKACVGGDDDDDDDIVVGDLADWAAPVDDDAAGWRRAVDAARARIEHSSLQMLNLELSAKHGAKAWRARNAVLEAEISRTQAVLEELERGLAETHAARRLEQTSAATSIFETKREVTLLLRKLRAMSDEISRMEEEEEVAASM